MPRHLASADEMLTAGEAKNLQRRAAYDRRAAEHGIDYDDRDRRAQHGREVKAELYRRDARLHASPTRSA